ncbi:hypothetical protein [Alkalithermobacter paradoxus]|uniref:Uncharacterized protein n=1 Tax=Alkalithermobacter paradoxus TaxID=29349 RepID=A0A1V4I523_9FIRM|nr:hypothetical protein CLOTH_17280 [[Clostridium] thermoalcaliphilum]
MSKHKENQKKVAEVKRASKKLNVEVGQESGVNEFGVEVTYRRNGKQRGKFYPKQSPNKG